MIVKKRNILVITLCLINLSEAFSQELDVDELLQRLDRIEKNISDKQPIISHVPHWTGNFKPRAFF